MLIPPFFIPLTCTKSIFTKFYQLPPLFVHFYTISTTSYLLLLLFTIFHQLFINQKCGSVSFFWSSEMHQSHHLVGCHATDINYLLTFKNIKNQSWHFLRLRTSRTNHSISGFLIIVPILIFEDSDILKQKSKKRTVLIVVQ